ncbi:MAG: Grx4 family monothiol glutaredoxin [Dokdonella sp.]|uniref:Grx4 family monothiol glutaredoxin n=1 Tax=Dokdonella sp. TaxID=2291710 RepID=UPI0025C57316|nr:Grx4 family monothiol glutaredoxin [Dokdonella sp.]MBZ0223012.1 Grx4 family monothiol glutaredoxin [Dokdonella sp.]MCC7255944.1 Grx4 family monothiol glutaredoxin [Dokdonella sp.]
MSLSPAVRARIEALLADHRVVLFMKGTRLAPQCGFSAAAADRLNALLDDYHSVNVLADEEIRAGIKEFGNWPTIPQLYVDGELVGGADIVQSMFDSGQLHELFGKPAPDRTPPELNITDAAAEQIRAALGGAGDACLFLVVDGHYQPQFQLREAGDHDIIAQANGLEIHFDAASAQRARGAQIDWTQTPHGVGLAIFLPQAPRIDIKPLDVRSLQQRLQRGELTVIDVRADEERAHAPFAGAEAFTPQTHARLTELPKDTPLAFLCHHGVSSRNAAEHFRDHGFTDLYNIEGGIDAWSREIDPSVPRY